MRRARMAHALPRLKKGPQALAAIARNVRPFV